MIRSSKKRRLIPINQRFQTGRVHEVRVGAVEFILDDNNWAKLARVDSEHLPDGKELRDYTPGQRFRVFLRHPIDESDYYRASLRWGDEATNPWTVPALRPAEGQLLEGVAIQYFGGSNGVFVRLEPSGIDAPLRATEVPGMSRDIRDSVDIGDRLVVQVAKVRTELLEVRVSVRLALESLAQEEVARRRREFNLKTVRLIPRRDWGCPPRTRQWVAVLGPDIYFANHLVLWLEAFGFPARRSGDAAQVERILKAPNRPERLVLPIDLSGSAARGIEAALKNTDTQVIWLSPSGGPTVPPFAGAVLSLPLDLSDLTRVIEHPDDRPALRSDNRGHLHMEYQGQQVQQIAVSLLQRICERFGIQAALWVAQEREGVLTPRRLVWSERRHRTGPHPQAGANPHRRQYQAGRDHPLADRHDRPAAGAVPRLRRPGILHADSIPVVERRLVCVESGRGLLFPRQGADGRRSAAQGQGRSRIHPRPVPGGHGGLGPYPLFRPSQRDPARLRRTAKTTQVSALR